jgi:RNA polymerase sigma-70 factor (ECF subfamily)
VHPRPRARPPTAAEPPSRETALAELAASSARRGFAIALDLLGVPGEAEDAVQEALARACAHIHHLREPDALRGWFFRVLVNHCMKRLRRRRLRRALLGRLGREPVAAPIRGDEALSRRRAVEALLAALDGLPVKQRAALVLRYGHDMPVAEVARALGVRRETAKTHLSRGLKALRARLAAELTEEREP